VMRVPPAFFEALEAEKKGVLSRVGHRQDGGYVRGR
jgi:hypothetical protein